MTVYVRNTDRTESAIPMCRTCWVPWSQMLTYPEAKDVFGRPVSRVENLVG